MGIVSKRKEEFLESEIASLRAELRKAANENEALRKRLDECYEKVRKQGAADLLYVALEALGIVKREDVAKGVQLRALQLQQRMALDRFRSQSIPPGSLYRMGG